MTVSGQSRTSVFTFLCLIKQAVAARTQYLDEVTDILYFFLCIYAGKALLIRAVIVASGGIGKSVLVRVKLCHLVFKRLAVAWIFSCTQWKDILRRAATWN